MSHDPIVDLEGELDALSLVLATVTDAGWNTPTCCDGWTVADVALHLAQTNEFATASLRDEFGPRHAFATPTPDVPQRAAGADVDAAAAAAVEAQRHVPPAEIVRRWEQSASGMIEAFRNRDLHDRVQWVAGTLSARTLVATRIAETWIHSGDIAGALGIEQVPTARLHEIARLAWRTLPYAFARAGHTASSEVCFDLTAPDGGRWWFASATEPPRADDSDDSSAAVTIIRGAALDLCQVAGRRMRPEASDLRGTGADAEAVLTYVRTYA